MQPPGGTRRNSLGIVGNSGRATSLSETTKITFSLFIIKSQYYSLVLTQLEVDRGVFIHTHTQTDTQTHRHMDIPYS